MRTRIGLCRRLVNGAVTGVWAGTPTQTTERTLHMSAIAYAYLFGLIFAGLFGLATLFSD